MISHSVSSQAWHSLHSRHIVREMEDKGDHNDLYFELSVI